MYENYKRLGLAIAKQAVKDYFNTNDSKKKKTILKELRSEYLALLTDGMGELIADQLELHPEEIKKKLKKAYEEMEEE